MRNLRHGLRSRPFMKEVPEIRPLEVTYVSRKPMLEALEDRTAPAVLQVAPAVVPTVTLAAKVAVAPAVVKSVTVVKATPLVVVPAVVKNVAVAGPAQQPLAVLYATVPAQPTTGGDSGGGDADSPPMMKQNADGPGPKFDGRATPLPDLLFAGKMLPLK